MSVSIYDPDMEPSAAGVAARLAAITAMALAPISALFFVGAAVISGITSVKGVSKTGVYADGSTLFVKGSREGNTYVLSLDNTE